MSAPDVAELVASTRLFLDRHEDALKSGSPARALEACEGLHTGLCQTLAAQAGAVHHALGVGDSSREAHALDALRKRMAETEGALLHLRLTLQKGSADGPAIGAYMRRLHAETYAVAKCLDGLRECLHLWAESAGARVPPPARAARDALRAARESLLAGVPAAAPPLLVEALHRAGVTDADLARELRGIPPADGVAAWRLLDAVERAVHGAGMTPATERAWAGAGR